MTHIIDLPSEILEFIGDFLDKRAILKVTVQNSTTIAAAAATTATTATATIATATTAAVRDSLLNIETLRAHARSDVDIRLRHPTGGRSTKVWEAISESLQKPRQIKVGGPSGLPKFEIDVQVSFWRAVSRFEELDYSSGVDQLGIDPHQWADLSGLQRLSYRNSSRSGVDHLQLKLFGPCHGLTRLRWLRGSGAFLAKDFLQCLIRSDWPLLDDLALDRISQSDLEFSPIIRHLPPLKHLRLDFGAFGPLSFGYLREYHFETLRTLDLMKSDRFTSRMALAVLHRCPHLEDFMGREIFMSHVVSMSIRPWVCSGLKRLGVYFANDFELHDTAGASAANRLVLEHLSRLTSLEEMDMLLNGTQRLIRSKKVRACRWRLGAGLEQLKTLTRLCIVRFDYMRVEDVRWMVGHWPELRVLQGHISSDTGTQRQVNELLSERRIKRE
ncbi:hypothetical protein BGZ97_011174 [Linnemannia gamsii]|uniref:F-box domain-containing protein n=1 Tax=Linnemannia gamsii TaxID=64522 RepID=A0A9P6R4P9_9FUNG|nr:hypothetical protein BGZ97_011174 [Linnemannia gamsii]